MSTTLVIPDEALTMVSINHSDDLRQMQRVDYPVASDLRASNEAWDGGEILTVPWDVDDHSNPTRLESGYESYDRTVRPTLKPGTVTPAFVAQPILVSLRDETVYSGPGKVLDVTKQRTENVDRHMMADIQKHVFRGPASGSWEGRAAYIDFNHFNGVDHSSGFFEATADGSNLLHGVAKASYPLASHPGFHNMYDDSLGAAGTNLLNDMYRMLIVLQLRGAPAVPSENRWYVGENPAVFLKAALRANEQYTVDSKQNLDGAAGVVSTFGGIGIIPCIDMPTNGTNTAGSPVSVLLINWKRGVKARFYSQWNWSMLPFKEIPGTAGVRAALKLVGGNIVAAQPGLCGLIENAEVY